MWSRPVTDQTSAVFGNMYEGNYTFKLKAQSPDGVWCEPIIYTFKVLPPSWRTWWAYTLYIAVFIAASIQKIALPTMEGLQMVSVDSIISCKSDSKYTIFLLKSKQKIIASRTLKEIEEMLEEYSFLRVHNSCIVNLNEVNKYIKGEGG